MRKADFFICESKGADQRRSICAADQRLCFRYIYSTTPLIYLAPTCSHLPWLYNPVLSDLVGNHVYRFSHDTAQMINCDFGPQVQTIHLI